MEPKIKTMNVAYQIKVNNQVIDRFLTLREARKYIKFMAINDDLHKVTIVKETLTNQVIDVYEPQVTKVLKASDLSLEL